MHSTRLTNLLTLALSITTVTGVAWLDNNAGKGQLAARQDDILTIGPNIDTSSTTDAPASSTDEPSSSTDQPDSSTTAPSSTEASPTPSSSVDTPTPTPTDAPTSSDGPTTSSPTNGPAPTTSTTSSTSAGGNGDSSTTDAPSTTAPPSTSTFITVITSTDAAGQTHVSSSSSVVISTPTPISDSEGNTSSTMKPQVKNTIIGVCVGVGGAIVLAAAGVLIWRLRSKRRSQEENEELVSYGDGFGGPGTAEKTEPTGANPARSPFQSTLESYHAPSSTNAASNF